MTGAPKPANISMLA